MNIDPELNMALQNIANAYLAQTEKDQILLLEIHKVETKEQFLEKFYDLLIGLQNVSFLEILEPRFPVVMKSQLRDFIKDDLDSSEALTIKRFVDDLSRLQGSSNNDLLFGMTFSGIFLYVLRQNSFTEADFDFNYKYLVDSFFTGQPEIQELYRGEKSLSELTSYLKRKTKEAREKNEFKPYLKDVPDVKLSAFRYSKIKRTGAFAEFECLLYKAGIIDKNYKFIGGSKILLARLIHILLKRDYFSKRGASKKYGISDYGEFVSRRYQVDIKQQMHRVKDEDLKELLQKKPWREFFD